MSVTWNSKLTERCGLSIYFFTSLGSWQFRDRGLAMSLLWLAIAVNWPGSSAHGQFVAPPAFQAIAVSPLESSAVTSAPNASPDNLESLIQRVAELEEAENQRQESAQKKADDEQKKKDNEIAKQLDWGERSKEKWNVKLGGHVQSDYVNWANADSAIVGTVSSPGPQDYFEFRRLRLNAEGTGYGVYDFRLQMTLEPETIGDNLVGAASTPDVKDAYLSINELPMLGRMRLGSFFVPFSLEQVTNDTNNAFMERSIPSGGVFAADREVGIAFYNATENQRITWTTGLFFDSISEALKKRVDDNQGLRLSGRLTALPLYDESSKGRYLIHTGIGILHTNDQDNRVRFRARPQIHEGPRLISTAVLDAESYTTGNLEIAAVIGSLTIQSEAFLSQVNLVSQPNETVGGAYTHLSYFLTGENRQFEMFGQHGAQFGRNVPNKNFLITKGYAAPGAVELKARWSHLNLDNLAGGQYNDFTFGTNWYWSDRVRWMFDWIHPVTSSETLFGATDSDLLALRFDFNW